MTMASASSAIDYTLDGGYIEDPWAEWTIVNPIFCRRRIDSETIKWEDSLVYIASSEEKAVEWCKRNTDIESRTDPKRWWWFVINQEAIDGDYSGIKGLIQLLDWDGNHIHYDPVDGYKTDETSKELTNEKHTSTSDNSPTNNS